MRKEKIIVVLPAYNASATLEKTIKDIPVESVDEIVLADDASRDNTVEIAKRLGLTVVTRPRNQGYGANQKTCYKLALEKGADYVVMIHPDYQYDSRLIDVAVELLRFKICDIVIGNRVRTRNECLNSGMPLYKYLANRFLTIIENIVTGQNLGEFHSGFRAYRREVLEAIPFAYNSDDFVFDAQLLMQAVYFNFIIGDIPMPVRYFKEASSIGLYGSIIYGLKSLFFLFIFSLQRLRLVNSRLFLKHNPLHPSE